MLAIASVASSDYLFTPLSLSLVILMVYSSDDDIIVMMLRGIRDTITRVSVSIRRGWPHCGVM